MADKIILHEKPFINWIKQFPFGGTLTLVLSLLYVLAVTVIGLLPAHLYYVIGGIDQGLFRQLQIASMVATFLVAVVVSVLTINLGIRSIRRMEV